MEEHWNSLKETCRETCITVLGRKKKQDKEWISMDTWKLIEEGEEDGEAEDDSVECSSETLHWTKKCAWKDKKHFYDTLASEAEQAAGRRDRDLTTLYQITRLLSGKRSTQVKPMASSEGNLVTKEEKQRRRWPDHFKKLLNRPPPPLLPATRPETPPATAYLPVNTSPPTKVEVLNAIKLLKSGKAGGPDGIPPEALKTDTETTANLLTPLLLKVCNKHQPP
ncbi:unnamed protein product [Heterobilharzia americana]|nr:unnamed protein product [Heterobilharzia americana]